MIGRNKTVTCALRKHGCRSEVLESHKDRYGWVEINGKLYCPSHAKTMKNVKNPDIRCKEC